MKDNTEVRFIENDSDGRRYIMEGWGGGRESRFPKILLYDTIVFTL